MTYDRPRIIRREPIAAVLLIPNSDIKTPPTQP
jgi:hypothetical protein